MLVPGMASDAAGVKVAPIHSTSSSEAELPIPARAVSQLPDVGRPSPVPVRLIAELMVLRPFYPALML